MATTNCGCYSITPCINVVESVGLMTNSYALKALASSTIIRRVWFQEPLILETLQKNVYF